MSAPDEFPRLPAPGSAAPSLPPAPPRPPAPPVPFSPPSLAPSSAPPPLASLTSAPSMAPSEAPSEVAALAEVAAPAAIAPPLEVASSAVRSHGGYGSQSFAPLRSEPPPRLFATWWLRYLLVLSQFVGIAVVLMREYAVGGAMDTTFVVVPHVMAAVMLVGWSAFTMLDAARLVPASRYQKPSRAWMAVVLWLGAFAAPVVALAVVERLREQFEDSADDVLPVAIGVASLLACFILVWLPFRYHVRQAHRIGAPTRVVAAWFWLPLFAVAGVFTVMWLGLHDLLADNGFTELERTVQLAVLYGVPATMFALTTWRATTVFDEVIDLRWMRWRTEWEQTLLAFAAQPPPGPEGSPVIDRYTP